MNNLTINNQDIKLEVLNEQIWTTSLQIAEVFGKEHKNIVAKIESLPDDEFRQLNFKPSSEIRKNGLFDKETKCYLITRDGFSLLVMGFTGTKAYDWKIAFIKAFNEMERRLKLVPALDQKFDDTLKALSQKSVEVDKYKDKYLQTLELSNRLLLEKLNEKEAPKKDKYLSDEEKSIIRTKFKQGQTILSIARQIQRSESAVRYTLKKTA